jgi:sugar/nucleoside kinase (ribokinase family)
MKAARDKGVETIINPAPAIPLPDEAYNGLGHLIVNETEASILSGIENPTSWDKVAAVFISRGVKNVVITLGSEVSIPYSSHSFSLLILFLGSILPNRKAAIRVSPRVYSAGS